MPSSYERLAQRKVTVSIRHAGTCLCFQGRVRQPTAQTFQMRNESESDAIPFAGTIYLAGSPGHRSGSHSKVSLAGVEPAPTDLRRIGLYPLSYSEMEPPVGVGPTASSIPTKRSTAELQGQESRSVLPLHYGQPLAVVPTGIRTQITPVSAVTGIRTLGACRSEQQVYPLLTAWRLFATSRDSGGNRTL